MLDLACTGDGGNLVNCISQTNLSSFGPCTHQQLHHWQTTAWLSFQLHVLCQEGYQGLGNHTTTAQRQELTDSFPGKDHLILNYCWQTHINPVLTNLQAWRLQTSPANHYSRSISSVRELSSGEGKHKFHPLLATESLSVNGEGWRWGRLLQRGIHPLPPCDSTTSWGWTPTIRTVNIQGKEFHLLLPRLSLAPATLLPLLPLKNLHMFSAFPKGIKGKSFHDLGSLKKASPGSTSATPAFASEMESPLVNISTSELAACWCAELQYNYT